MSKEFTIPYNWTPRGYQLPAWTALEQGAKRSCLVWHRRAGKDLFALNWCVAQAFTRVGRYWHVLPTLRQGREVVWEARTNEGRPFLDHIPDALDPAPGRAVTRKRDDEMTLWLANGSSYKVVGGDEVDRLIGSNPVGIVFSEWSVMDPRVWELLRPILAANGGWAIFIFTPRGRNHGWRLFEQAKKAGWYVETLTVGDTKAIPAEAIEDERRGGMPEEMVQQEFYVSFDAPLVGAYYGDLLRAMKTENRIARVPWEPNALVTTGWDLGVRDATALWFHQKVGREHHLIDFYYAAGMGLDHYAKVLHERPYAYKEHLVPHDAAVRELGAGGASRIESAAKLGMRFRVMPRTGLQDGINAVRSILPMVWMDEEKCSTGLEGLRQYRKERLEGAQGPNGEPIYRDEPAHTWASHPADALRTLAQGLRSRFDEQGALRQPDTRYIV